MTYEFAKYPDGTLGVFSNIGKKENGEEYIRITLKDLEIMDLILL